VVLGDCAAATVVPLAARGHLVVGSGGCLASAPGNDQPVVVTRCRDGSAEQYWVADSDGFVWNGRPPEAVPGMDYDHVRCLAAGATADAPLGAPLCGDHLRPHWRFVDIPGDPSDTTADVPR
jgi:hypothetical protein